MTTIIKLATIAVIIVGILADEDSKTSSKPPVTQLRIGIKRRIPPEECTIKAGSGDKMFMHYTGTLYEDGSKFDSSLDRGEPFVFNLGVGQVIKGWDKGLLGACIGEKRRLVIPPEDGYGANGAPPKIPANAVLVFEVEVLNIQPKNPRGDL